MVVTAKQVQQSPAIVGPKVFVNTGNTRDHRHQTTLAIRKVMAVSENAAHAGQQPHQQEAGKHRGGKSRGRENREG